MAARPPRRSRPRSDGRAAATAAALRRGRALPSRPAAPRLRGRRREGGPHLGAAPVRCRGSEAEPLLTGSSLSAPQGPAALPHLGPRQRCSAADPPEYPPQPLPAINPSTAPTTTAPFRRREPTSPDWRLRSWLLGRGVTGPGQPPPLFHWRLDMRSFCDWRRLLSICLAGGFPLAPRRGGEGVVFESRGGGGREAASCHVAAGRLAQPDQKGERFGKVRKRSAMAGGGF